VSFNSFDFLYLFVGVYAAYWFLPRRAQNLLLLAASYFFYGVWDWRFLGLLVLTTVVDFGVALAIEKAGSERRRKLWLWTSIAVSLGVLGYFKYAGFFVEEFSRFLGRFGADVPASRLDIVLPVGISFYTFQTMSYVIDVYRRRLPACKQPLDFALYVAFFPQLVAGPIERAGRLLPQMQAARRATPEAFVEGAWLILLGYFKKVVVADNLIGTIHKLSTDIPFVDPSRLAIGLYTAIVFIYADFSGYSDIARGLGRLLGFELRWNFRMPFFAKNPPDFWRRWHITMTEWLRDYLFNPLARLGSGRLPGKLNLILAVTVTMLLGGLWHGAAWNFLAFGAYHAAVLLLYLGLRAPLGRFFQGEAVGPRLARFAGRLLNFHVMSFGAIIFLAHRPSDWIRFWERWTLDLSPVAWADLGTLVLFAGPMVLIDWWLEKKDDMTAVLRLDWGVRLLITAVLFAYIVLCGVTETNEFVYFQF
jgi:alginate O-acetyltransferase complex protein AlgI